MGAWYKDFYLTNAKGEKDLRMALNDPVDGAANKADVQKRLGEMKALPDQRCYISSTQIRFLEHILDTLNG